MISTPLLPFIPKYEFGITFNINFYSKLIDGFASVIFTQPFDREYMNVIKSWNDLEGNSKIECFISFL